MEFGKPDMNIDITENNEMIHSYPGLNFPLQRYPYSQTHYTRDREIYRPKSDILFIFIL